MKHAAATFVLLCSHVAIVDAQVSVTTIGTVTAMEISADGSTVVGRNPATDQAYVWTAAGGLVDLPSASWAMGVSADGSVILGELSPDEAALWSGGAWQGLGAIGNPCGSSLTSPYDLSDDGTVAVGLGWQGCSTSAFRWTAEGGMEVLPKLDQDHNARANAVSGDGSTVGGWEEIDWGGWRAVVWWPDGTEELVLVSPSNPDGLGMTWGFSTDGTWACGSSEGPVDPSAWIFSKETGLIELGFPPGAGAGTFGSARAVSDDGKTVVGNHGAFGAEYAFIWREGVGIQWLDDYLASLGVANPPPNMYVTDMTADGRKIVGHRTNGPILGDGFVIELPPHDCGYESYGAGASPANTLALAGAGDTSLGATAVAITSGSAGGPVLTLLSLGDASFPILGGVGLIDPSTIVASFVESAIEGVSSSAIAIPNVPSFAGLEVYLQSMSEDGTQPGGWAFSNGLKLVVCP